MKKALLILIFLSLILPIATFGITIPNPIVHDTFEELIIAIINFLFTVALVIAPLMIIVGAFHFLTAAGDPKGVETGKKIIIYTLIGFVVILLARGIVEMIRGILLR